MQGTAERAVSRKGQVRSGAANRLDGVKDIADVRAGKLAEALFWFGKTKALPRGTVRRQNGSLVVEHDHCLIHDVKQGGKRAQRLFDTKVVAHCPV